MEMHRIGTGDTRWRIYYRKWDQSRRLSRCQVCKLLILLAKQSVNRKIFCRFAVMSVVFVLMYSIWYMRSFFLAILGIVQIVCTLPITFFVCQLIHRIPGVCGHSQCTIRSSFSVLAYFHFRFHCGYIVPLRTLLKKNDPFAGYEKLTDLGVMNVLSLYLLLGIGVDDLYVMTDAFRQARDCL